VTRGRGGVGASQGAFEHDRDRRQGFAQRLVPAPFRLCRAGHVARVLLSAKKTAENALSRPSIDDLARRVLDALPHSLADNEADLRRNLRAALSGVLARMDVVTREEFDAQSRVLARTREKLDVLERHVTALETRAQAGPGRG